MNKTFIALTLALFCGYSQLLNAQPQALDARDLNKLERSIEKLQKKLSTARSEHNSIQQQLKHSESAIGQLEQRIEHSAQQQSTLTRELAQHRQQRTRLQAARQQQQNQIAAQLRRAYQLGREDGIKLLLNQQNPAELTRAMTYLSYINRARMTQLAAFSDTLEQLVTIEQDVIAKSAALQMTATQLEQQKHDLEQQQQQRQLALQQLNATISSHYAQLKQQQKDRDALEKLVLTVEDVSKAMADSVDGKAFSARKGKMTWPVSGKRINRFGARRSKGGLQWEGMEIRAKQGTPVQAIHQGRVLFADWFRGQGLLIIIDHGDGYLSLYSHNHSLLHAPGDWVNAGDAIATVGSSGGRQENALYFEIRQQGKAQNPTQWCTS